MLMVRKCNTLLVITNISALSAVLFCILHQSMFALCSNLTILSYVRACIRKHIVQFLCTLQRNSTYGISIMSYVLGKVQYIPFLHYHFLVQRNGTYFRCTMKHYNLMLPY